MREPPSKAVALRTRGSQFDFALNSRRTVENGADRARFSCSLCPQPLRSRRRELLKCLEMLRLKTPSSRSKSPNSRAACAKVRPKSGQSRRARRRAQNTRSAHMGILLGIIFFGSSFTISFISLKLFNLSCCIFV